MAELRVGAERNIFNPNTVTFDERLNQLEDEKKKEKERAKREKNSPYSRWTQFNNDHTKEILWLGMNHPKAHVILIFLVDQMDAYNAVMCSYHVLQEVFGISGETVRKNIKVLKDNGFIAVLKSGTSNVYAINDCIYWKSWGSNKKYSKFPANIVLALSEQEEEYKVSFEDLKTKKHKEVSKEEKT